MAPREAQWNDNYVFKKVLLFSLLFQLHCFAAPVDIVSCRTAGLHFKGA